MGIYEVMSELVSYVKESYRSANRFFAYFGHILVGVLLALIIWFGYLGYHYYIAYKNRSAQKSLSEYISAYHKARKKDDQEELKHVGSLFELGYEKHGSSQLGPVFLAYQADIQADQGNTSQAIDTLRDAIASLSATSPLIYVYKIKQALMLLDSTDQAGKKEGEDLLIDLASDEKNHQRDYALFYLGRYYWANNTIPEAKKAWQELVDMQTPEITSQSPWVREAEEKLRTLQS